MEGQLHFDPQAGKFVEVYPVMPGTCQFCKCPINAYAVMNYKGCCEHCWNEQNGNEFEERYHNAA